MNKKRPTKPALAPAQPLSPETERFAQTLANVLSGPGVKGVAVMSVTVGGRSESVRITAGNPARVTRTRGKA